MTIGSFITIIRICKIRISTAVVITTAIGILFQKGNIDVGDIAVLIGLALASSGSCALNEAQDWQLDARMERTKHRPIPSGKISEKAGAVIGGAMIAAGAVILLIASGVFVSSMALLTSVMYNALYTPLKRKAFWAFIPGALIGAMPPFIGWWAAGGRWPDAGFAYLLIFMIAWQMPHFWNLMLAYRLDYKNAGLPVPSSIFSENKIAKITTALLIIITIAFLLPIIHIAKGAEVKSIIIIIAIGWLLYCIRVIKPESRQAMPLRPFHLVNLLGMAGLACMTLLRLI